jgi:hypothetical protein
MEIKIKVVESLNQINKGILNSFVKDIKQDIDRGVSIVKNQLPQLVNSIVISSPEYSSLLGGTLKYELGIPDANTKIAAMIDIWSTNILYQYKPPAVRGQYIVSKFSASLFKADFSDIIGTDYAKVYDRIRGYNLPWLEWLVFYGNAPLIDDYQVILTNSSASRTGRGLMRRKEGSSWRVPSEFSGIISDNWITRAIAAKSADIQSLLERAFK